MPSEQAYPEHEKICTRKDEKEHIEAFLHWLFEEKNFCVVEHIDEMKPECECEVQLYKKPEQLLAEFFGVDLDAFEKEKEQMLDAIRKANAPR